jgi:hypothetical protein
LTVEEVPHFMQVKCVVRESDPLMEIDSVFPQEGHWSFTPLTTTGMVSPLG